MSTHSFDPKIAAQVGVNAAVIYYNLEFWIEKNAANDKHFHDGHYWTYNSVKAFSTLFPYLTARQIRTALDKLIEANLIKTANYNKAGFDKTMWYTICAMDLTNKSNGCDRIDNPIPDSKPDKKTYSNHAAANALAIKVIDLWNSVKATQKTNWQGCEAATSKRVSLTNKRIELVRNRLSENGKDPSDEHVMLWFTGFLTAMAADPFYSGKQNNYKLEYGQFMAEDYFVKTIERLNDE